DLSFFFQPDDRIRVYKVTGVQTCALPISGGSVTGMASTVEGVATKLLELALDAVLGSTRIGFLANPAGASMALWVQQVETAARRSEERRVGKDCTSWSEANQCTAEKSIDE